MSKPMDEPVSNSHRLPPNLMMCSPRASLGSSTQKPSATALRSSPYLNLVD